VLLPARNRKDLEDIPQSAREKLAFVWLEHVDEAVEGALHDAPQSGRSKVGDAPPAERAAG
jgi:ATP-dependent Lon protease